ncbi:MAG: tetratricopeptide repeat protein, partial [Deltaproteobacteria bacterium]|nr:tetratricopeptide repeat protein [Deltaproteobacteria bacterium]
GQKAVDLGPSNALSHILYSQILNYAGAYDLAVPMAELALKLCPKCPAWYEVKLGRAYADAGRYEDAIRIFQQVLKRAEKGEFPLFLAHSQLVVNYSMTGQYEKARHHLNETLRDNPGFSLELVRNINFYKDPRKLEAIFEALREAGLSDKTTPVVIPPSE